MHAPHYPGNRRRLLPMVAAEANNACAGMGLLPRARIVAGNVVEETASARHRRLGRALAMRFAGHAIITPREHGSKITARAKR